MNFSNTPTTTTASGFTFGSTGQSQISTFGATGGGDAGAKPSDSQLAKGFGNKTAVSTTQSTFSFGPQSSLAKPTTTATSSIDAAEPSKGIFGASTSTPLQTLGTELLATSASPSIVPSTTNQKTSVASNLTLNLSTSTKTTDSTNLNQVSKFNFGQLEEHINKWTLELEEQEKGFSNQATQINAWDKLLIANNDKIVALNDAVQKVKTEQQTLEQELEFIATQHAELEESITPLQKDLHNIPQVDVERTQTYLLVENLDTQLKQMSEDLKEVIDYLNEANKAQDNSDPIVQIGKILNAHMSSLQWIESSSSAIALKLDDISKMHECLRRDSERSFRLTYYD